MKIFRVVTGIVIFFLLLATLITFGGRASELGGLFLFLTILALALFFAVEIVNIYSLITPRTAAKPFNPGEPTTKEAEESLDRITKSVKGTEPARLEDSPNIKKLDGKPQAEAGGPS